MNTGVIIKHIISVIFLFLIQLLLVRNFVLFGVAFSFIYVGILAFLPVDTNRSVLISVGFLIGIVMDLFYDTLGMHAASCVLVCYLRTYLVNFLTPTGGYDNNISLSIKDLGLGWYLPYLIIFVFIHHFALFFLEIASFHLFFYTLLKIIASTLFTVLLLTIGEFLFYPPSNNR